MTDPTTWPSAPAPDHVRVVRTALTEAVDTLALVEQPAFVDPDYGTEVAALGDRIGYGALMASASASWRQRLSKDGMAGGEFVAGPCRSTILNDLKRLRAALPALDAIEAELKWRTEERAEWVKTTTATVRRAERAEARLADAEAVLRAVKQFVSTDDYPNVMAEVEAVLARHGLQPPGDAPLTLKAVAESAAYIAAARDLSLRVTLPIIDLESLPARDTAPAGEE